ncbi:UDP-3-O-(3-hydroxymyristoyl)glucosamine N-acyltransferase [Gilvimarinus sp. DA14]|uniref:UDP-3-O-(3-hydroxymyristoyl)glucosamine N-acyltransferase n=1 Tax=Gilvimarinus sp. DA14 TaxID=2956798 RepID=UPI0020B71D50|nr:UDP-3-O-(3-hydroxymyristoyl)glucosamine N-acyltransferase [Gilvimarinus sp. DA14]UTF60507.1 UDP-3-O-(3-hydroxymyristoyl)glucosamine N-acyltransferase [Gilvimarinus sp. DA14]
MTSLSLREIADFLSAKLEGNAGLSITGIAGLVTAKNSDISFLANKAYEAQLQNSGAGAVILREQESHLYDGNKLIVADPYLSYARLSRLFDRALEITAGIHPSAVVDSEATLGANVTLGPHAVIGRGVVLGDNVVVGAGSVIGDGSRVGARTRLAANVSIYHDVVIGEDCLFHSSCVIGADGFGFAPDRSQGGWCKIHQLGGVVIGSRVEVGATTTIDRGALDDTVIEDGVIIDDQVHVAHNCHIGANTAIAANCGIAGSTKIGRNCTLAGAVGIVGHIEITDNVHITGMTMVSKSITEPGSYSSGTSAIGTREWRKNAVRFNQLNDLAQRLRKLESGSDQ